MSATDIVTYHLFSIYIEAMWMVNVKTHEKKEQREKKCRTNGRDKKKYMVESRNTKQPKRTNKKNRRLRETNNIIND